MSEPATPAAVSQATPAATPAKPAEAKAPAKDAPKAEAKQGDAPKADAKSEAKVDPKEQKRAEAWEKITSQEARLRDEQKKTKAEREAFERDRAAFLEERKRQEEATKLLTENPVEWMQKFVGDKERQVYEDLTKRYLNDGKITPDEEARRAREEVERLRKELTEDKQREAEARQMEEANRYMARLSETLKGDDYELIRTFGAEQEVVNLVTLWAQQHGELLTPEEAAGKVEKELESQLPRLRGAKKFQALLEAQQASAAEQPKIASGGSAKPQQTLTNDMSAAGPIGVRSEMTRRQRREALAAQIKMPRG